SEYWPFCDHNALILIDDTLAYSCQSYCLSEDCSYDEKCYGEMFLHSRNYEIVTHSEKLHIFRYEFTEKSMSLPKRIRINLRRSKIHSLVQSVCRGML
ncbi:MAG: hypothetical protein IKY58_00695, partial [Paludibacteraceae bacterium]|nr:hypothetical protein [Paludibacteraceae bacterium]